LAGERSADVVSQIGVAEEAEVDLAQVEHARDRVVLQTAYEEGLEVVPTIATGVGPILLRCGRRMDPRPV
jgi:hypothetical protein